MSEWQEVRIAEVALPGRENFVDGDWIESTYITDEGVRLIQTGNVGVGSFINRNQKFISDESFDLLRCKDVFEGDVLICRLADPIGRACIVPELPTRNITSVDVVIMRVDESRFDKFLVVQLINDPEFLKRCSEASAGTTRQRISRSNLGKLTIRIPPLPTQRRIAAVLRTVDEVIEATEARIEKQQAIKQGLLHDLFTRGVSPEGQLRPPPTKRPHLYQESELGLIPKEWEVSSFGKLIKLSAFGPRFPADAYDAEGNVALLTTTDMDDDGNVKSGELTRARLLESAFAYHFLEENDLLISRSGTIGVAAVFSDSFLPTLPGAFLIRFRFLEPMIAPFFRRYFNHPIGRQRLRGLAGGGVLQNLKGSAVMQLPVPVPSETEIAQVSHLVEAKFAAIETDISTLHKLRQLKSALMQDLLTGRVSAETIDLDDLLHE